MHSKRKKNSNQIQPNLAFFIFMERKMQFAKINPYKMSQLAKARNEHRIMVLKTVFLRFLFLINPVNKMAWLWNGILTKLFKLVHMDSRKPWESHVKTRESAKYSTENQESRAKTCESLPYLAHGFKKAVPNPLSLCHI